MHSNFIFNTCKQKGYIICILSHFSLDLNCCQSLESVCFLYMRKRVTNPATCSAMKKPMKSFIDEGKFISCFGTSNLPRSATSSDKENPDIFEKRGRCRILDRPVVAKVRHENFDKLEQLKELEFCLCFFSKPDCDDYE